MNKAVNITVHGITDVGMVRDHNEDNIAWDEQQGIVLLADGMGGHNAGEVASELAVNSIRDALADVLSPEVRDAYEVDYQDAVRQAVIYANQQINEKARDNPACAGMGTTIVMTLFFDASVVFANVGDSRIYRFRENKLQQITTDHSLVQEMIDNGFMSEEEAQQSLNRNLITRALGIAEQVDVDVNVETTQKADVYLLCSDGLSDMAGQQEIERVLQECDGDLENSAKQLVELANQHGGHDNISVILVKTS